jgi:2-oxoisovalerate dehydrogenase E2 component (dihydrolipoyl transacylase)
MRFIFKLPDVGEGTAEAEIVAWHVKVGDTVAEDQHLVDVMTDKATVEMTSPVAGTVVALNGNPGDMATVGAALVEFETEVEFETGAVETPLPSAADANRFDAEQPKALAAPAVRKRAADHGVALGSVQGSGPEGRITHDDLDAHLGSAKPPVPRETVEEIKLTGLARRMAERMQATTRVPHFSYVEEIDMTEVETLRTHLNATRTPRLTVLPFLMRALVRALPDFPQMNAHYDDEAGIVKRFSAVHIGIATQTDVGLTVPVVKNAERRDLWDSAREIATLAERARASKAAKEDLSGATITLTSLGPQGGLVSTPILNLPEVAILAPNAIRPRPVVCDGAVVVRKMMNLSASFDHRVVDGAGAAAFIQRMKALLEHPALLFMAD